MVFEKFESGPEHVIYTAEVGVAKVHAAQEVRSPATAEVALIAGGLVLLSAVASALLRK